MSIVKQSLVGASGQGGGYTINDSLRFRSSASAYLNRTFTTPTSTTIGTYSFWIKRGKLSVLQEMIGAGTSNYDQVQFLSDTLRVVWGAAADCNVSTPAVFRDPSAWYHIVIAIDTPQALSVNRLKVYVNGVLQTLTVSTTPTQNATPRLLGATAHFIGCYAGSTTTNNLDGYMTEVNFIDGQALDPTDFGEFDANGTWKAKEYTGTYGTNGFYLDASTSGSTVLDQSGNSNNWTANNMNLTTSSATTYDLMKDVPTLTDEDAGNFATLNPLKNYNNTLADGNLNISATSASTTTIVLATIGVSSGKWYWEYVQTSTTGAGGNLCLSGLARDNITMTPPNPYIGLDSNGWGYYGNGYTYHNAVANPSYGATYGNNDVIGVAFDADVGTLVFYKNGVSQGTAYTGLTSGPYFPAFGDGGTTTNLAINVNFGQRSFAYTPPTGFLKLNTFNLPDSTIEDGSDYFNTVLYTGNGGAQAITGVGFTPSFIWAKSRSNAYDNLLVDAVRGGGFGLKSNTSGSELASGWVSSFDSDGFTYNVGGATPANSNGATYVAWNWKANGSGVSNSDGTITTTVSANPTAGFSIASYVGTGANATIGHGLSAAPDLAIFKNRDDGNDDWWTYNSIDGATKFLRLNTTAALGTSSITFNDTEPTSTVFSIGTGSAINTNGDNHIAYFFKSVDGYSKIGSYTGNGSTDGPFVYTGFRPAYLMVKRTDGTSDWVILDTERDKYNIMFQRLDANSAAAENTAASYLDAVSNGFKTRTTNGNYNTNGGTYIYMAFAENPFKNANAR